ncbi:biopolymer transporter ExbD [Lysobacter sp. BMK333-48F3]|uniref:Biopolymer transporter ExbD n=1 Tax=Lysobacter firmicutimachus TaxID=1792846 RepID=A0AAU8MX92_9GAMM|nr:MULTISPECIES: biopolymer transporter ExbD [Lysobacter]MBX9401025.1 biopolymer transporter ExbD [Lysobacter sp. BMK333-48F3]
MAFSNNSDSGAISDINVTPLVDVLLVLLIIFMVTAPTVSYPIDVNLPQPTLNPPPQTQEPPPPISLRIDATGTVFWNNNPTPLQAIPGMMKETVQRDPTNQPLLEIDTNDDAEYGILAKVLAYAKNADMKKIGFVQK